MRMKLLAVLFIALFFSTNSATATSDTARKYKSVWGGNSSLKIVKMCDGNNLIYVFLAQSNAGDAFQVLPNNKECEK